MLNVLAKTPSGTAVKAWKKFITPSESLLCLHCHCEKSKRGKWDRIPLRRGAVQGQASYGQWKAMAWLAVLILLKAFFHDMVYIADSGSIQVRKRIEE